MIVRLHISGWIALLLLAQLPSSTAKAVHFGRRQDEPAAHEAFVARQVSSPPSPTNYAPFLAACPSATASGGSSAGQVRDASTQKLGPDEATWIERHQSATQQGWKDWLKTPSPGPNLNGVGGLKGGVDSYLNNLDNLPKLGIALSGGSFRATVSVAIDRNAAFICTHKLPLAVLWCRLPARSRWTQRHCKCTRHRRLPAARQLRLWSQWRELGSRELSDERLDHRTDLTR